MRKGSGSTMFEDDLRHSQRPQCHTQNNFFKLDNKRREDENVSNNDDDAFHEVQKNDLLENLSYQKSPSGASRLLS